MDYFSTIAETTQSRKLLRINFNKFNEVKALSAFDDLLRYVNYLFFEGEELELREKQFTPTWDIPPTDTPPSGRIGKPGS
ncbi:hypothetical protein NJ959_20165 [Symplocastrum sp. BBK-W-15]|uniref:Uncharacterized protein n=1 Tax=Limnofasciculus baicalensis BBK-W-15 TaxID=2699891 RepID=A0AAE3GY34_9CYAN|nr:hypothetical protein [Limnofasciculus baicalensis BBK-W-15]